MTGASVGCRAGQPVVHLGLVLEHHRATPEALRERAARMLTEPAFQDSADRLRDEALARPAPADAVADLERIVEERRTTAWTV